jgi:hypothetical protein
MAKMTGDVNRISTGDGERLDRGRIRSEQIRRKTGLFKVAMRPAYLIQGFVENGQPPFHLIVGDHQGREC